MDIYAFFAEYDHACHTETKEALENMLLNGCKTHEIDSPEDNQGLSALYNELGAFYRGNRRKEESEEAFLKAKALLEKPLSEEVDTRKEACPYCNLDTEDTLLKWPVATKNLTDTIDYATTLNNLAGHYRVFGEYEKALELFQEVRKRYGEFPEIPIDVYASSYNNTGLVYLNLEQADEAEIYFLKAMEMVKDMENNAYVMGTTYQNLSYVYLLRKDGLGACEHLEKAAKYFLELEGKDGSLYQGCMGMLQKIQVNL